MKELFLSVLTSKTFSDIFTVAMLIGALSWLARIIIENSFSKSFESYKNKIEIQNYKFQSLHPARAEVIKIFLTI